MSTAANTASPPDLRALTMSCTTSNSLGNMTRSAGSHCSLTPLSLRSQMILDFLTCCSPWNLTTTPSLLSTGSPPRICRASSKSVVISQKPLPSASLINL